MKMPITGMSRFEISKIKTLTPKELGEKVDYYRNLALQWSTLPNGSQQANKYFTAMHRYEREVEKHKEVKVLCLNCREETVVAKSGISAWIKRHGTRIGRTYCSKKLLHIYE